MEVVGYRQIEDKRGGERRGEKREGSRRVEKGRAGRKEG